MHGLAAAFNTQTRFVFHVSSHASSVAGGLLDWLIDWLYSPITAELEKRGFPSMLVHSSVSGSDTPNEDRAAAVVKALQNVTDHVVIVGTSNEGNFLPLVAAARPIRRVVYVNAVIPRPGKAFIEVCQTEQVAVPGSYLDKLLKKSQSVTDDFLKLIHDPNATKAQLKAMQERIDASTAAHTMVATDSRPVSPSESALLASCMTRCCRACRGSCSVFTLSVNCCRDAPRKRRKH